MKKLVSLVLAAALALCCACPALADSAIGVTVNGAAVAWTDARPFIDANSRTLCPLRAVGEAMGMTVGWEEETRTATFTKLVEKETDAQNGLKYVMEFPVGGAVATFTSYALKGGSVVNRYSAKVYMDTAAVVVDGRTYAPVRYLAEGFEFAVEWDGGTRTVRIHDHAYWCDFFAQQKDHIGVYLLPGRAYGEQSSVELVSASVNGAAARTRVLDAAGLAGLQSFADNAFYAFCVYGNFECDVTYTLELTVRVTWAGGASEEYTDSVKGSLGGYGGYDFQY